MICILKGAVVFFVDLVREIDLPMTMDFMAISSYGSATKSSGVVRILKDLDKPINGRDVLIIEDIVDSGMTLSFLKENLLSRGAASLHIATLLDKPERRRVPLHVDYFGFTIPDEFVVGYGLDYAEKYRNTAGYRRAASGNLRIKFFSPRLRPRQLEVPIEKII